MANFFSFWPFTVDFGIFNIINSAFELLGKKSELSPTKFVSSISFESYIVHKFKVLSLSSLFACVALASLLNSPLFEHVLSVFFILCGRFRECKQRRNLYEPENFSTVIRCVRLDYQPLFGKMSPRLPPTRGGGENRA